jgi:hypothetical protein
MKTDVLSILLQHFSQVHAIKHKQVQQI